MQLRFHQPVSIEEAHEYLQNGVDDTVLIGGGTAMVLALHNGTVGAQRIVHLGRIRDERFREIKTKRDGIIIGGGVTITELIQDASIREKYPSLVAAGRIVATPRIRNTATVAGSVLEGNFAADLPTALAGVGAEAIIESFGAKRRVPVYDLVNARIDRQPYAILPGEILTRISVPHVAGVAHYLRRSRRRIADRPLVSVASVLRRLPTGDDQFEAIIGGATARLERYRLNLESGWRDSNTLVEGHLDDLFASAVFLDDHRASAWYREELLRSILRASFRAVATQVGNQ